MSETKKRKIGEVNTNVLVPRDLNEKLTDDHINGYMDILNTELGRINSVKCMSTFFSVGLLNNAISLDKRADRFFKQLLIDGDIPNRIVIPIHLDSERHWGIMCVFTDTHHIIFIDSTTSNTDVFSGRHSTSYIHARKIFTALINMFEESKMAQEGEWSYMFCGTIPWIFCVGFHIVPQDVENDRVSCGYYILVCSRLFCEIRDIGKLVAFEIKDIDSLKPGIVSTLAEKTLGKPICLKLNDIPPMRNTLKVKIIEKSKKRNLIRLKCLMNPNKISYRTEPITPKTLALDGVCGESIADFGELLQSLQNGSDLSIVIAPVTDEKMTLKSLIRMLNIGFETLVGARGIFRTKKLNLLNIMLLSDTLFEVIRTTTESVAFYDDLRTNGIQFDAESGGFMTGLVYDILACYFHSMVLPVQKLSIYVSKQTNQNIEECLLENVHRILV